ncbi:CASP-like protein [Forsythia ovata]|uniref:CASP-like protein n=1 Tax=Forsythia ovata TaxID=205694 RepID=A0ABD1WJL7_9LAMI
MNMSQGAVHPVEALPLQTEGTSNVLLPRVRMKDFQGMMRTVGVFLRFSQLLFVVVALSVMATTTDFASVTVFCYPPIGARDSQEENNAMMEKLIRIRFSLVLLHLLVEILVVKDNGY